MQKTSSYVIPRERSELRDLRIIDTFMQAIGAKISDLLRAAFGGCSLARVCGRSLDSIAFRSG